MTEREKNAEIKAVEAELAEIKKHRKPSSKEDNLAVESMAVEQSYRENKKELEVLNSRDAVTSLSDVSVKANPGGFEEVNSKENENIKEPEL